MNNYHIRFIEPKDHEAALAVYAPYVLTSAASFEYEVPTAEVFAGRIAKITAQYPWLVCECDGKIVAYAYSSVHHDRPGYQWCTDVTVYINEAHHRKGLARILYTALFDILRLQGYYTLYANVLSTNTKSVAFHRAMGFEDIGLYKNIGYKLGAWQTNLGMQYALSEYIAEPKTAVPFPELRNTKAVQMIIENANLELTNRIQQ